MPFHFHNIFICYRPYGREEIRIPPSITSLSMDEIDCKIFRLHSYEAYTRVEIQDTYLTKSKKEYM